ncbi:SDR family oxidoreductase [Ignavibacteria bacterium 4148-Me]|uniref:SDR family oxidoreductase n=1 Tax=Rosettibacter primus TaxID=3111523 RepID=UPI00336BAF9E
MKVLFIGGTGNISTSVSKLCIEKGIDLYLLNRGLRENTIEKAKAINGDINNLSEIKEILKDHQWDVVVNWIAFNEKDIERDIELFKNKTKQYIFISSASAYQKPPLNPIITESTPLKNPFWDYSRNKIACEEILNKAYREEDFPITIVRPSLTYDTVIPVAIGGWNEYTIIDRMKKGKNIIVHGDGTSLWVVTHTEDFAKGFVGILGNQYAIGNAFHITTDEVLTWNQIYETIAETISVEPNIIHIPSDFIVKHEISLMGSLLGDKSYSVIFDNSKIKKYVPGFTATISFKEGIKRTIDWFEAKPERKIIRKETDEMMDRIIRLYEKNI